MANCAYLSIWSKGFTETTMLEQLEQVLKTVPFSAQRPGFTELLIRAVDPAEAPLLERDLRSRPLDAAELVELLREHRNSDSAYEIQTHWDLWTFDAAGGTWRLGPQGLRIVCHGEEYDSGVCPEVGNFQADIGFEHLFTGHAGLLGVRPNAVREPQHPAEAHFLAVMAQPENLRAYHEKTCENIRKLMDWVRAIEEQLPVARYQLWSEGEENFEAWLDEILAVR